MRHFLSGYEMSRFPVQVTIEESPISWLQILQYVIWIGSGLVKDVLCVPSQALGQRKEPGWEDDRAPLQRSEHSFNSF